MTSTMNSATTSGTTSGTTRPCPDRTPVVVAVDSSDDSVEAAAWAAERAVEWGAPLHMVAAVPGDSPAGSVPSWLGVLRVAAWRAGRDPDVIDVVRGSLQQAMADRGGRARLMVVPGSVHGPVPFAPAGRVACPVVVCRDGQSPSFVSAPAVTTGAGRRTGGS